MHYEIKNWREYQHYKDRNPPWIKLHYELITSRDWVKYDDASKLLSIVCLMLASRNEGKIDDDLEYIKSVAHLNKIPNLKPLIASGFLIPASELKADASTTQADAIIEERREEDIEQTEEKPIRLKVFLDSLEEMQGKPISDTIPDQFVNEWVSKNGEKGERMWKEWDRFLIHFADPKREYKPAADCKRPTKIDWLSTWRNWIIK